MIWSALTAIDFEPRNEKVRDTLDDMNFPASAQPMVNAPMVMPNAPIIHTGRPHVRPGAPMQFGCPPGISCAPIASWPVWVKILVGAVVIGGLSWGVYAATR